MLFGGGQEHDRRAGTENLTAIYGLVLALERHTAPPIFDPTHLSPLTSGLRDAAAQWDHVTLLAEGVPRLPNTVALAVHQADPASLLAALDLEGICASGGSACSAGSSTPSHVLTALGLGQLPGSLLRFSLGRGSSDAEVRFVIEHTPRIIERVCAQASGHDNR